MKQTQISVEEARNQTTIEGLLNLLGVEYRKLDTPNGNRWAWETELYSCTIFKKTAEDGSIEMGLCAQEKTISDSLDFFRENYGPFETEPAFVKSIAHIIHLITYAGTTK